MFYFFVQKFLPHKNWIKNLISKSSSFSKILISNSLISISFACIIRIRTFNFQRLLQQIISSLIMLVVFFNNFHSLVISCLYLLNHCFSTCYLTSQFSNLLVNYLHILYYLFQQFITFFKLTNIPFIIFQLFLYPFQFILKLFLIFLVISS